MSFDICRIITTGACCLAVVIIVFFCAAAGEPVAVDPVLEFYCGRAAAVFTARDPIEHGLCFSFTVRSYYKSVGRRGNIEDVDSAVIRYHFSFGHLDSQKTVLCTSDKLTDIDFSFPNVFSEHYLYNFYPNDTGGVNIAIGFDTDSVGNNQPVGLALIDREQYILRWLYLFYPHKSGFRRFSRSFRMTEFRGFVFPDSLWEVGAAEGVFSTDDYRLETCIESIEIHPRNR
ncbi:MAG: hypothetical protein U9R56_04460 [candidate division Zixibacteria bacterium]|nr:hypothetical protein [candidate division Zixibacteria bacterium]